MSLKPHFSACGGVSPAAWLQGETFSPSSLQATGRERDFQKSAVLGAAFRDGARWGARFRTGFKHLVLLGVFIAV